MVKILRCRHYELYEFYGRLTSWETKLIIWNSSLFPPKKLDSIEGLQMILLYIKAFEQESQIPYFPLQAYPSLKPLASWTRDLVQRVEHFEKWASTAHPPIIFWMSAFTFPTGFLTAVLQTCARQNNVSLCFASSWFCSLNSLPLCWGHQWKF